MQRGACDGVELNGDGMGGCGGLIVVLVFAVTIPRRHLAPGTSPSLCRGFPTVRDRHGKGGGQEVSLSTAWLQNGSALVTGAFERASD